MLLSLSPNFRDALTPVPSRDCDKQHKDSVPNIYLSFFCTVSYSFWLSPKIKLNLISKFCTTSSDSKSTIEPVNQITQQTNTFSTSTKEILEKGVNMFKVNNKGTRMTSIT